MTLEDLARQLAAKLDLADWDELDDAGRAHYRDVAQVAYDEIGRLHVIIDEQLTRLKGAEARARDAEQEAGRLRAMSLRVQELLRAATPGS